jgi:hypothetical protein
VIQEAYVLGVSPRGVDALIEALGGCHVSRSEVGCERLPGGGPRTTHATLTSALTQRAKTSARRIVSQGEVMAVQVWETGDWSVRRHSTGHLTVPITSTGGSSLHR